MPASTPLAPTLRGFSSRLLNMRDRVSSAVNNGSGGGSYSGRSLRPNGHTNLNAYGYGNDHRNESSSSLNINPNSNGSLTSSGSSFAPASGSVRQSWREWAGEKIRNRRGSGGAQGNGSGIEKVSVFPGWAVRKFHGPGLVELDKEGDVTPFDLELFVSGFAASYTPPEAASRSQRTFMKVARAFASLPKLEDIPDFRLEADSEPPVQGQLPRPDGSRREDDILDDIDVATLEAQFANANVDSDIDGTDSSLSSLSSSSSSTPSSLGNFSTARRASSPGLTKAPRPSGLSTPRQGDILLLESEKGINSNNFTQPSGSQSSQSPLGSSEARLMHKNLDERLHPFWSRSIPNRLLRLTIYCRNPQDTSSHFFQSPHSSSSPYASTETNTSKRRNALDISEMKIDKERYSRDSIDETYKPLFMHELFTSPQGSFQARIKITWETMCTHPGAVHIAFGNASDEPELYVQAELSDPPPPSPSLDVSSGYAAFSKIVAPNKPIRTLVPLTITQSHVRLISDIDDTIKLSNILGGARAVFRNVFTRRLEELVIQGMGDWYTYLWSKGVRFHYVSNSPFELLPSINEFIKISNLPRGSIRLRSYAGKSLFNNLLSAPGTRKREGIIDLLNAFDSSRFILVGDTGEQDLELYAQLAQERPHQIAALYLRDVRGPEALPLVDPTGEQALGVRQFYEEAGLIRASSPTSVGSESPISLSVSSVNRPLFARQRSSTTPIAQARFQNQDQSQSRNPFSDTYYFAPEERELSVNNINGQYSRVPQLAIPKVPQNRMDSLSSASSSSSSPSSSASSSTQRFFDSRLPISDSPPAYTPPVNSSSTSLPVHPRPPVSPNSTNRFRTNLSLPLPGALRAGEVQSLSPAERKQYELQMRVYKARLVVPKHISLRVFREADECVEESAELLRMLEPRLRDKS